MADSSLSRTRRMAAALAGRSVQLLALALALVIAALVIPDRVLGLALLAGAGAVAIAASALRVLARPRGALAISGPVAAARAVAASDLSPAFATAADGQLIWRNEAARRRFGHGSGPTLSRALGELFASPADVIRRLGGRAAAEGAAREDVVTPAGHMRIMVQALRADALLWRFEEFADRRDARGADALALPMVTLGRGGTVLFANSAARTLFGARPRRLSDFLPGGPPRPGALAEIVIAGARRPARVIDLRAQGGRRELYILPVESHMVASPTVDAAMTRDELLDALPAALCQLDPAGRVQRINRPARALLGRDSPGFRLSELLDGPGRPFAEWLADAAEGRIANPSEVVRLRAGEGRSERHVQIAVARAIEDGAPTLLAVLSDASAHRTLEAQLIQSQKMQAVGQLAGGIAHDFNNVLTAISGHCDLMLRRSDETAPDYPDLVQIRQNTNRAADLVAQLLAFSRQQTRSPERLDMRRTVADMTHLLNRLLGERVRLRVGHDGDLAPIEADRRQIEQIVMNLAVNARDAMPEGGEVAIELEMQTLDQPMERDRATVPPGRYLVTRIADQGMGIPPDKQREVFEPFFTTKAQGEGTGLGLATVYGIVKQGGGFIFLDSAPGAGTTFTLYFPAREGAAEDGPGAPDGAGAPRPHLPGTALATGIAAAPDPHADGGPEYAATRDAAAADPAPAATAPAGHPLESVESAAGDAPALPFPTAANATDKNDPAETTPETEESGPAPRPARPLPNTATAPPRTAPATGAAENPRPVHADCDASAASIGQGGGDQPSDALPTRIVRSLGEAEGGNSASGHAPDRPAPGDSPVISAPAGREIDGPFTAAMRGADAVRWSGDGTAHTDPAGGTTILVVEDEAPVRALAMRALTAAGYHVLEADGAEEALARIAGASRAIDLLLTDVVMPDADGPAWVGEVRQALPGVGVLFVSGYADGDPAAMEAAAPGARFLAKPFALDELVAAAGAALADRGGADPGPDATIPAADDRDGGAGVT